jgi:thiamine biosynthesis protein ThiS
VNIRLNGEPRDVHGGTIADLLAELDIDPRRVAVERNLVIVKREQYVDTPIADGDEIEIVNFVGGGCEPFEPSEP